MYRYPQKKPCKFEGCSNMPALGCGGYCFKHRESDPAFDRKQNKKAADKDAKKLRMLSNSNFTPNTAAATFVTQENWYTIAMRELAVTKKCQECGGFIPSGFYRHAIAHILQKRKEYGFPSVATHPSNRLFLCAGNGCHQIYDSSWEAASKMKVWPLAVIAFVEMYPFIDPSEHKNIPDILRQYIPKL